MRRWWCLIAALVAVFALMGCAKRAPYEYASAPMEAYDMEEAYGGAPPPPPPPAPASAPATTSALKMKEREPAKGRSRSDAYRGEPTPPADTSTPADEAPAERMVHYSGWARIEATKTEDLLKAVSAMAEGMGGFVEQLTADSVTVRVPVSRFEEAFKAALAMGEVLDKSVSAEDVTDAFLAVDLRLRTAKSTRDRLVTLLAQAKTESEKLQILAQIRRLSEQIDVMEGQLRTLASLANFSRITVQAQPREAFAARAPGQDPVGFSWIHALSPFSRAVGAYWKLSPLEVPTGFVALDIKKRFIAESADGAVIWTARLDNDPAGDAAFWTAAIRERIKDEFKSVEEREVGGYKLLRFVSETDDAYRYVVGVRVDGDQLHLVQVYYPDEATEQRYQDAVRAVIAGGKS